MVLQEPGAEGQCRLTVVDNLLEAESLQPGEIDFLAMELEGAYRDLAERHREVPGLDACGLGIFIVGDLVAAIGRLEADPVRRRLLVHDLLMGVFHAAHEQVTELKKEPKRGLH